MELYYVVGILITLSTMFAMVNNKVFKMPKEIGLMFIAMIFSFSLLVLGACGVNQIKEFALSVVNIVDFNKTLMLWMLAPLLFNGAKNVNLDDLIEKKWEVGILATVSVFISAVVISVIMYYVFIILGIPQSPVSCFILGSLMSPTDPIAAIGILIKVKIPKGLETKFVGESLFNDGFGIVMFLVALEVDRIGHFSSSHCIALFFEEVIGGSILGLLFGLIAFWAHKITEDYLIEILISLSLVFGGYATALFISENYIHVSGPIMIVVSGLFIGNHGRRFAMSRKTRVRLDMFWNIFEHLLNLFLFVLIGLELLVINTNIDYVKASVIAVVVVLFARYLSVLIPIKIMKLFGKKFAKWTEIIMTWGGLRGGISIALALSLPESSFRELFIHVAYFVVGFSILVQGTTIKPLVKKILKKI